MLTDLWYRVRALLRPRLVEQEADDELRLHLERQIAQYRQQGMSDDQATRRARLEFGGLDQVKEACRDVRGVRWLQDVGQDLRLAARLLVKDRLFAIVAVLILALGIGATTAMFTMVNAALLRGLPNDDDRMIFIGTRDTQGRDAGVSLLDFQDWQSSARTVAGMAAYFDISVTVADDRQSPELSRGPYISADIFRLLRVQPLLGRDFAAGEDRAGAPGTVVLSHALWQSRYGGDPTILGRTIRVDNRSATVIGVMPPGMRFPRMSGAWVALGIANAPVAPRSARTYEVIGRLAEGISLAQARAELETIAGRLAQAYPETNTGIRPVVERFSEREVGGYLRRLFLMLMGAVVCVLLIACANIANLLFARAAGRSREVVLRAALGASRGRLMRQLLAESLMLSAIAAVVGIGVAVTGVRFLAASQPYTPYWITWTPDIRVLGYLILTTVITGVLFGVGPALQLLKHQPSDVLKEGGRSASSGNARRWTTSLLVTEVALTLMLLTGAGLMIRSFQVLYRASLAVDASNAYTTGLRIAGGRYNTPDQRKAFFRALEERLEGLHELSAVTMASSLPFAGGYPRSLAIAGRTPPPDDVVPTVTYLTIGSRYFETLRVRLVRGRVFTGRDGQPGEEHAIVNQRFAERFFPNENPLGQRIRLSNPNVFASTLPWVTIVGVSPTIRQMSTGDEADAVVYLPFQQDSGYFGQLLVRPRGEMSAALAAIRTQVATLDPDLPLSEMLPLEEVMAGARLAHRSVLTMMGLFAVLALLLASIGVYGVTAYTVTQRTHEIGIRLAIGAHPWQVVWMFVRRALVPLTMGLAVGIVGVWGLGRFMGSLLVQTSATDPAILLAVATVLVTVALAASIIPARRAARLNPVTALRAE
jgi:putative ABC transport system permease protein